MDALNDIEVDWFSVCVLGSIIPGIVEAFYGHRLYLFSRSKLAAGVVFFVCHFIEILRRHSCVF